MRIEEVADQCLYESGARGFKHGREVALVGLAVVPDGEINRREFRQKIRDTFCKAHSDERGSIFLIFILPMLISLISNWIVKWIWSRKDRTEIRASATATLCGSSPRWTDTLMSINSPPSNRTEQQP